MKKLFTFLILITLVQLTFAQSLKIKSRKQNELTGSEFFKVISDSTINLETRENLIFEALKRGNVPDFLRKVSPVHNEITVENKKYEITYFSLPDYIAIGSNEDYFYMPMTPILAQRVANLFQCSLPTKKMVDLIYEQSEIKLPPIPIPPTKAMTTVPIFKAHSEMIQNQLTPFSAQHHSSKLTSGHKKDIILSNKIYTEKTPKVVIYGWHQLNGKAIQPVYNKHSNTWADYSHGVRLIKNKIILNGKKTRLKKILADPKLHPLLSDEGIITKPYYP